MSTSQPTNSLGSALVTATQPPQTPVVTVGPWPICHALVPRDAGWTELGGALIGPAYPDSAAYHRLVRRLRPAAPSPVVFALVVAGLLTGTLALTAWAETPYMPAVEAVSRGEASV